MLTNNATILVVDDIASDRITLEVGLTNPAWNLLMAENGEDAIELALRHKPDVILLDIMMPEMDGFEVCRRLRANEKLAEVPIIMLTALDNSDARLLGIRTGADDFIGKPFDLKELRARVANLIKLNRYRLLHAERERFEQLVTLAPVGIVIPDGDNIIRLANPAMHQMLGMPEQTTLVGRSLAEFVQEENFGDIWSQLAAQATAMLRFRSDVEMRRYDGSRMIAEIHAGCQDWQGQNTVQLVILDVTDQREMQKQLLQAQKMEVAGQLVSGVAHDFNGILMAISTLSEMIMDDLADHDPRRRQALDILQAVQQGSNLSRQLLQVVRPAQVSMPADGCCWLNDIVQALLPIFKAAAKRIEVQTSLADDLVPVQVNANQLPQVILNLFLNARDAMPKTGGRISLSTYNRTVGTETDVIGESSDGSFRPGRFAVIEVMDNGHGMSESVRKCIFRPFFTTKGEGQGTGLGLAVVKRLVDEMKGTITVESQLGEGSTFRVYLPQV